jgi:hypothetical protein
MTTLLPRIVRCACLGITLAAAAACHRKPEANPGPAVTRQEIDDKQGEPIEKQIQSKSSGVVVTRTPSLGSTVVNSNVSTLVRGLIAVRDR